MGAATWTGMWLVAAAIGGASATVVWAVVALNVQAVLNDRRDRAIRARERELSASVLASGLDAAIVKGVGSMRMSTKVGGAHLRAERPTLAVHHDAQTGKYNTHGRVYVHLPVDLHAAIGNGVVTDNDLRERVIKQGTVQIGAATDKLVRCIDAPGIKIYDDPIDGMSRCDDFCAHIPFEGNGEATWPGKLVLHATFGVCAVPNDDGDHAIISRVLAFC